MFPLFWTVLLYSNRHYDHQMAVLCSSVDVMAKTCCFLDAVVIQIAPNLHCNSLCKSMLRCVPSRIFIILYITNTCFNVSTSSLYKHFYYQNLELSSSHWQYVYKTVSFVLLVHVYHQSWSKIKKYFWQQKISTTLYSKKGWQSMRYARTGRCSVPPIWAVLTCASCTSLCQSSFFT